MFTINYPLWAKKEELIDGYYWLPLGQHLEDTRRVAGRLWHLWLSEGQRELIIDSLDERDEELAFNLICFLASIHDLGKATPAFQLTPNFASSHDLDSLLLEKLELAGFTDVSQTHLLYRSKSPHAVAGQFLLELHGVNSDLSSIVGAHHGKPVDSKLTIEKQFSYPKNYFQTEDRDSYIYILWSKVQNEFLIKALELADFQSIEDLPEVQQPGQVIISGLIIMADWIASNTNYFPLFGLNQNQQVNQDERIEKAWGKWDPTEPVEIYSSPSIDELYHRRFSFDSIRSVQSIFSEVVQEVKEPGIFILEAPMGIGKTEAALVAAEQLAYKTERSGLFFGLPTQATSNGIFPRLQEWLESVSNSYSQNTSLQLIHGKASLNKDFMSLSKQINIDDEVEDGTVIANQWFSGSKKACLDDFVVGTVDQFLMNALKQKHLALRHFGFSKKVVIIDEVHAYDAYMGQYLQRSLTWMGSYGVPVILLSATLPAKTRENLIYAYLKGKGTKRRDVDLPEDGLAYDSYPLITYSEGTSIIQKTDFPPMVNKPVSIFSLEEEELFTLLEEICENKGVVGIIVNTVDRAQKIAEKSAELFGEDSVEIIHSRFIDAHRYIKEEKLMSMIGKNAIRPEGKIIVGTQVMEQSLDIDFDVLITDLAPMDLLIQRIGRLHRHDVNRPEKYKTAQCYILGVSDSFEFERGSKSIYGSYLLARTQYFLPEIINIPEDISKLVQSVYGDNDLQLSSHLNDIYNKMAMEDKAKEESKELRAKTFRLSAPVLKKNRNHRKPDNLIGLLKEVLPTKKEEEAYAQVRDTEETIEVIAVKQIGHGYGLFSSRKDISNDVIEPNITKELAKNTLKLPNILTRPYNIEQTLEFLETYNLKYLAEWQKSHWLRGSLGIIFDEGNNFEIGEIELHYDEKYGLMYERKGE